MPKEWRFRRIQEHAHFENNDWHYTKCLPSVSVTGDLRAIDRSQRDPPHSKMTCFILADMGIIIMVIYVFASKDVKVNTPTTLKGRSQLDAETVVRDRRNASKRLHVEGSLDVPKPSQF